MAIDAISGGIHSTASTAAFLLYHLASNPDKQDLLYQEILATVGPTGRITEHAINKMSYLSRCLRESQSLCEFEFLIDFWPYIFTSAWSILSSRSHVERKSRKEKKERKKERTLGEILEIRPDPI